MGEFRAFSAADVPLVGTQLIEASAGTGKTYTLTTLLLRMLLERELEIGQVLVVTYTRAATAELRDRVRGRLKTALVGLEEGADFGDDATLDAYFATRTEHVSEDRARLAAAVRNFDEASIFTIHGFCQRALLEGAFESGANFDVNFIEDQRPLLAQIAADYWATHTYGAPPAVVARLLKKRPPEYLAELASLLTNSAELRLLPASQAPLPAPADPEHFDRLRAAAARAFAEGRGQLERILVGPDTHLHRGRYPEASVRGKWLPFLETLTDHGASDFPSWFAKLTVDGLQVRSKKPRPTHPFFVAAGQLWEAVQETERYLAATEERFAIGLADYLQRELPRRKRQAAELGFDDLLRDLDGALSGPSAEALLARLRGRYRAALIDEFQDTDPVQFRVFSKVFGGQQRPLFLIGDPKQAIYGFRGADVYAYLSASRAQAERPWGLATNYRSAPGLVEAVNQLFAGAQRPFGTERIQYQGVRAAPRSRTRLVGDEDAPLQLLYVSRDVGEGGFAGLAAAEVKAKLSAGVAAEVAHLLQGPARLEGRAVHAHDVAVLCRTNAQARAVQDALRRVGIPSALEGDSSVFDSPTADELRRVLMAMSEPGNRRSVRSALATSLMGATAETLFGFDLDGDVDGGDGAGRDTPSTGADWDTWVDRFLDWHATWNARGFAQAFFRMLQDAGVARRVLAYPDGERRLTNLLHLGELLHAAASSQLLKPLSLLAWFGQMCADEKARVGLTIDSAQIRLESDDHAVRLTTIHKSKGLEYPIVVCPYLWDARTHRSDTRFPRFHDDDDVLCVDVGAKVDSAHSKRARAEAFSEELRLLYVALTRAKHRCYAVWGSFSQAAGSAFAHLLHGPTDAVAGKGARERLKKLSDDERRSELADLCRASSGGLGVRSLRSSALAAPRPSADRPALLRPALHRPPAVRAVPRQFRVTSFTGLTATDRDAHSPAAHSPAALRAEAGRDRDAGAQGEPLLEVAGPAGSAWLATSDDRVPLHGFPAGAGPGTAVHAILEDLDFFKAPLDRVLEATGAQLPRHGLAPAWAPVLAQALHECLYAPLSASLSADLAGLSLADVRASDCLRELEFTLRAGTATSPGSLDAIVTQLVAHGAAGVDEAYAERLRALGTGPFFGFLRGFVDLVFRHNGRYYVVDYKSNHLGPSFADYAPESLLSAMRDHHYLLQYQLYSVALHRHLALCLPGYRYEAHFGGVFYLFLRGMGADRAPGQGVFFDRPNASLVTGLANVLCGMPDASQQRPEQA